jgi:flagellum-specific peptidoglycan hydrolase FlgJ
MTPKNFIEKFTGIIIKASKGTGLFPSVFMAQAILESGWGGSSLASKYNNFFGIKADSSWKGKSIRLETREVFNGKDTNITDGFRVYDSPEQSFYDRVAFLKKFSRYKKVFIADSPENQAWALQNAGYATDPNYANALIRVIKDYNLKSLDEKKKS